MSRTLFCRVVILITSRWRSPAGTVLCKGAPRDPVGPAMTGLPLASSETLVCWSADRAAHRHRRSSDTPAPSPGNTHDTRTHTGSNCVKKDPTIFYHCCVSMIRPTEPNTTQQVTYQSQKKEILSSIYTPTGTRTHRHVAKHTVTLLSGSTWTK